MSAEHFPDRIWKTLKRVTCNVYGRRYIWDGVSVLPPGFLYVFKLWNLWFIEFARLLEARWLGVPKPCRLGPLEVIVRLELTGLAGFRCSECQFHKIRALKNRKSFFSRWSAHLNCIFTLLAIPLKKKTNKKNKQKKPLCYGITVGIWIRIEC